MTLDDELEDPALDLYLAGIAAGIGQALMFERGDSVTMATAKGMAIVTDQIRDPQNVKNAQAVVRAILDGSAPPPWRRS